MWCNYWTCPPHVYMTHLSTGLYMSTWPTCPLVSICQHDPLVYLSLYVNTTHLSICPLCVNLIHSVLVDLSPTYQHCPLVHLFPTHQHGQLFPYYQHGSPSPYMSTLSEIIQCHLKTTWILLSVIWLALWPVMWTLWRVYISVAMWSDIRICNLGAVYLLRNRRPCGSVWWERARRGSGGRTTATNLINTSDLKGLPALATGRVKDWCSLGNWV